MHYGKKLETMESFKRYRQHLSSTTIPCKSEKQRARNTE